MAAELSRPFLPGAYRIKLVTEGWELAGAHQIRRDVFCDEQQVFPGNDLDAIDKFATPIVALSYSAGMVNEVAGTVRIHEAEPGVWWGSRLAVRRAYRRVGVLGPALIKLAVTTAHARGANKFLAHVQSSNAPLFHKLHWQTRREELLHGRPHHFMEADLNFYQPWEYGPTGFLATVNPLNGVA